MRIYGMFGWYCCCRAYATVCVCVRWNCQSDEEYFVDSTISIILPTFFYSHLRCAVLLCAHISACHNYSHFMLSNHLWLRLHVISGKIIVIKMVFALQEVIFFPPNSTAHSFCFWSSPQLQYVDMRWAMIRETFIDNNSGNGIIILFSLYV